jgi:uncharacterized protein YmfQ (DUF2313 family)
MAGLVERYRDQLKALLPLGAAWTREAGSNLHKFLDGVAAEAARIHERALDLMAEADPSRTVELLTQWEAVWGLPGACVGELNTLGERRAALLARMTFIGNQTPGFFVRLAASVGYTVTIEENVGGDPTVWRVNAPAVTVRWARAGQNRCGDRIRMWGNDLLECTIEQANPAHLTVLFGYGA